LQLFSGRPTADQSPLFLVHARARIW
jgi:hypothetical protein